MASKIYNVDENEKMNPVKVKDAIVECFYKAHCLDAGLSQDSKDGSREYCIKIIMKAFKDTNGDFDNPNKESIMKVMEYLAKFSKNFRDPEVIKKHFNEIMILVNKLD